MRCFDGLEELDVFAAIDAGAITNCTGSYAVQQPVARLLATVGRVSQGQADVYHPTAG